MAKQLKFTINADGREITLLTGFNDADYISLTDIAKYKSDAPADVIKNWLRSKDTIAFLGTWEKLYNPDFKLVDFDQFKNEAGSNAFVLSPKKWIDTTNAIGMVSKSGKYGGGTFAHVDIALEFASWVSPEFKLYIFKDYQRLKGDENVYAMLQWNVRRDLTKINYRIHTDAIKTYIVPQLTPQQISYTYANEADLLNMALFGKTAKQWREENPGQKGNMRDHASLEQLVVLSNLESMNAELIKQELEQHKRLEILNKMAISQMKILNEEISLKSKDYFLNKD